MKLEETLVAIVSLFLLFGGPVILGLIAILVHYSKRKKMYEAMTKMIEMGKKPEEVKQLFEIQPTGKNKQISTGLLLGGIIVFGVALGLVMMALVLMDTELFAPALFIGCIALAMIAGFYVTRRMRKRNNEKREE